MAYILPEKLRSFSSPTLYSILDDFQKVVERCLVTPYNIKTLYLRISSIVIENLLDEANHQDRREEIFSLLFPKPSSERLKSENVYDVLEILQNKIETWIISILLLKKEGFSKYQIEEYYLSKNRL